MAMRECSLHFDFMNEQKQLDLDKARELFGIAQKLGIHTYNRILVEKVESCGKYGG